MTTALTLAWEAPTIRPHGMGEINKFGHRARRHNHVEDIDGVAIEELVATYGSPVFVSSERGLRRSIRHLRGLFERYWPTAVHGWSYKTNYTSAVCMILHQEGSLAEVVSQFEYDKARRLGVPGDCIVFNGPNKPRAAIHRALSEGARLHVDHFDELAMVSDVARALGRVVPIGLRLNFETGFTEAWSRFGFNLDSGQAEEAIRRIIADPYLRLAGLHTHIGTFILDPRAYGAAITTLCRVLGEAEALQGIPLDYLDIGGGFPSRNALQGLYLPPDQAVPDLEDYVRAIADALARGTADRGQPPIALIYESGRAVVDDHQQLITSVVGTKALPDGRRSAVLDAGVNALFTAFWYDHEVRMTRPATGVAADTVLYGPLCMNIDVVRRSIQLPPLVAGDRLVIANTGAYNNTQWMQFIEYRPAIALVLEAGGHCLIRAAETLDVMCQQDRLPPHLATIVPAPLRRVG
ncbi:MAG: alanine racemase [Alphaproteobacteria bacterium]|nr:alanine racemase [Alphaproteobacteria bacterium]